MSTKEIKRSADGSWEAKDTPPTISFFEDDEGENIVSGHVLLFGKKVWYRALSAEQKEYVNAEVKAINEETKEVQALYKAFNEGEADALPYEEIEGRDVATGNRLVTLHEWVIEQAVKRWELTRPNGEAVPCNSEMKRRLHPEQKIALYRMLLDRSTLAIGETNFLGAR